MPDKIVNHFVLADGSTAKYDAGSLLNLDGTVSLAGYAPDAKAVGDKVTELESELKNILDYAKVSFTKEYAQEHPSTANALSANIPVGHEYYIFTMFDADNVSSVTPVVTYSDSTKKALQTVTVNTKHSYIAEKDIVEVGIYVGSAVPTGTFNVVVWDDSSVLYANENIDEIKENIGENIVAVSTITATKYSDLFSFYDNGYISSSNGAFHANSLYSVFTAIAKTDGYLWVDDDTDLTNFLEIVVYKSTLSTDDFLRIGTSSSNTLPYENSKMPVSKGNLIAVVFSSAATNNFKLYCPDILPVKSLTDAVKFQTFKLTKTSSTNFNVISRDVNGSHLRYEFVKYLKTWDSLNYTDGDGNTQTATNVVSADCWNNIEVYNHDTGEYIAQGNTNFICNIDDSVDKYIGDGHGNEVLISFDIIADGEIIDIESMNVNDYIDCGSLRIIARSNIYRVGGAESSNDYSNSYPLLNTSGSPIVALFHYMEIEFKPNGTIIDNKIVLKQNNITFNECHGAMLECQFTDFDTVICNNEENTQNEVSDSGTFTVAMGSTKNLANTAQKCNIVEMFGKKFYIRQSMSNDTLSDDTTNVVYFNKYTDRLKGYFQPIKTVNRSISGVIPDTFNVGDVIAVTAVREINI